MDAGPYLCLDMLGAGAVCGFHLCDGFLSNTGHSATPAGMDGANGMMRLIVEQDGDAVGSRHADAHATQVRHQCIVAVQCHLPLLLREGQQCLVYTYCLRQMYLMGHQQTVIADAKQRAKCLTVLADAILRIATIAVDVEFPIVHASRRSLAASRAT